MKQPSKDRQQRVTRKGRRWTAIASDKTKREQLSTLIANCAISFGVAAVANATKNSEKPLSKSLIRYHRKKLQQPYFRKAGHGGLRWVKFMPTERQRVARVLWNLVKNNPQPNIQAYAHEINVHLSTIPDFPDVSYDDVRSQFLQWDWSWKIPATEQMAKYTVANLLRRFNYINWIHTSANFRTLKFLDEVHFESKNLLEKKLVGPKSYKTKRISGCSLDERYTATCLLTPQRSQLPLEFVIRKDTNTQWDFYEFISHCVETGALVKGDHLVLDNASIHAGLETFPLLEAFLGHVGVKMVFLPAYSPELNPAEMVFAFVKNFLRRRRKSHENLLFCVSYAFSLVSAETLLKFYKHCVSVL